MHKDRLPIQYKQYKHENNKNMFIQIAKHKHFSIEVQNNHLYINGLFLQLSKNIYVYRVEITPDIIKELIQSAKDNYSYIHSHNKAEINKGIEYLNILEKKALKQVTKQKQTV